MYFFVQSVLSIQLYKSCPAIMSSEVIDVFCCKTSTSEEENWVITANPPSLSSLVSLLGRGGVNVEET